MNMLQRLMGINLTVAVLLTFLAGITASSAPAVEDLRKVYNQELQGNMSVIDVPQALIDELLPQGYLYPDIRNAYVLSLVLESSTRELIKLKPKDLSWTDFAARLVEYKAQRKIMNALDKQGTPLDVALSDGTTAQVASKEDVLLKVRHADPALLVRTKACGITEEETLGLIVLIGLHGATERQLTVEILFASGNPGWREEIQGILAKLDIAVGLGK